MKATTGKDRIAVFMTIYPGLEFDVFRESLESALEQEDADFTVFVHAFGKIAPEILEYVARFPQRVVVVWSDQATPISDSLNRLIDHILKDPSYTLLARMDADDIAVNGRFRKQVAYLREHPDVAVVGGWIEEFYEDGRTTHLKKTAVDPEDIRRSFVLRCAMNHPTVMFRRHVFEDGFRYEKTPRMEDVVLWSQLLAAGYKLANLPESVLRFRIGRKFFARRRGLTVAAAEFKIRWNAMRLLNDWSVRNVLGLCGLFAMRFAPQSVLRHLYLRLR